MYDMCGFAHCVVLARVAGDAALALACLLVFLQQFLLWFCRVCISSIPPMRVDVDTTYVAVLSCPRVGLSNGMQHVGVADVRSPGGGSFRFVSCLAAQKVLM